MGYKISIVFEIDETDQEEAEIILMEELGKIDDEKLDYEIEDFKEIR